MPLGRRPPESGEPSESVEIEAGLCAGCRHAEVTGSRRGSRFWRCRRSDTDPVFPRYPRLPVAQCTGHEAGTPEGRGLG